MKAKLLQLHKRSRTMMVTDEDEVAKNIALARRLYYSGKLGAPGRRDATKFRRRSSTGSMATSAAAAPSSNIPFNQWSMDVLRDQCNFEILPNSNRRTSDSSGKETESRRDWRKSERNNRKSIGSKLYVIQKGINVLNYDCFKYVFSLALINIVQVGLELC